MYRYSIITNYNDHTTLYILPVDNKYKSEREEAIKKIKENKVLEEKEYKYYTMIRVSNGTGKDVRK